MKKPRLEPQKFSQYFNLPQNVDFDFLDIYAFQDIALFLDPYGISAMGSKWAIECENQITTYFQYLIDSIRTGDKRTTSRLLGALHEVDEVALGYSSGEPSGRGIGQKQAKEIQLAFETSEAAKSGDIKDIADCALMIPGINRDKISDITSNILKKQLIEFTQQQCKKYSIPIQKVAVNNAFDYDRFEFISYYTELPVINGRPKILLPINAVRQDPELSKDKYYRNFVIEFLKAEHQHAGDSLASVLRNGKVVVRIADLKEKYPLKAEFLYEFSKQHPVILEKYKSELRKSASNKTKVLLETKRKILNSTERLQILSATKPGNDDANNFHKISYDNLIHIFSGRLKNPDREKEINEGQKQINIVFDNCDKDGFFYKLSTLHQIQCPKIFFECKNYGREIGNPEVDQLLERFSSTKGKFGVLLCRSIENKQNLLKRCKDIFHDNQDFIIVLDDTDIITLLKYRDNNSEVEIDDFMQSKLDEITKLSSIPNTTRENKTHVISQVPDVPTVVVLTAISVEYNAVRAHLQNITDFDRDGIGFERGEFVVNQQIIAYVIIRECGSKNNIVAQETEKTIQFFKPQCMLFIGIAGSRKPNDFKIGDVIFPEKVYYYEAGKATKKKFLARPESVSPTFTLIEKAKKERNKEDWKTFIKGEFKDVKADIGIIASGEQVIEHYDSSVGKLISDTYNDTSAVEMEGFGFLKATQRQGYEQMSMLVGVVRGISDILEREGDNDLDADRRPENAKLLASDTAAAFAMNLILKIYSLAHDLAH